jgi:Spy/CpxP family protein refolding chaperone
MGTICNLDLSKIMKGEYFMKVRLKHFVYFLMVVGTIMFASNVFAQRAEGPSSGRANMRGNTKVQMLEIFRKLNITPVQEKQLEALRNKHKAQSEGLRKGITAKKEDLRNELQREERNMKIINRIHSELKSLRSEKADHKLERMLDVRKILTAEQFTKFRKLRKGIQPMKKRAR